MSDITLIKKYLPEELWDLAKEYQIPDEYLSDMPGLIEMVLRSKSIDSKEEKQNWFNLLPLMNEDQIEKLKAILLKEKSKLEEIDRKYEDKKREIKKKYLLKWQKMGYVKQVTKIHATEQVEKSQSEKEAEDLLDMI